MFGWKSDLLFLSKSGIWTEIEIKVSRADFLADLKKVEKHSILADKEHLVKPNRFFYAVPEGLIQPEEVPEYAGLLWVMKSGCHFTVMKRPAPLLHGHKITPEDLMLADKFYYNMMNAKRDALIARNELAANEEPYEDGLRVGRAQGIQAALQVMKTMCPFRQVDDTGSICCQELGYARHKICDQGLCNYLADVEDRIHEEMLRLRK